MFNRLFKRFDGRSYDQLDIKENKPKPRMLLKDLETLLLSYDEKKIEALQKLCHLRPEAYFQSIRLALEWQTSEDGSSYLSEQMSHQSSILTKHDKAIFSQLEKQAETNALSELKEMIVAKYCKPSVQLFDLCIQAKPAFELALTNDEGIAESKLFQLLKAEYGEVFTQAFTLTACSDDNNSLSAAAAGDLRRP